MIPRLVPSAGEWAQCWAVSLYEMRRVHRGTAGRLRLLFLLLPCLLTSAWGLLLVLRAQEAFTDPLVLGQTTQHAAARLGDLAEIFRFFVLPFVLFLGAADLFGSLFRSEVADRTLHHVLLAPVRREVLTTGKYVAGVVLLSVSLGASWILAVLALLVPHGPSAAFRVLLSGAGLGHLAGNLAVIALGSAAYGGLFLAAGLVLRSPVPLAAALWAWERLTVVLPRPFKMTTLFFHLESLAPVRVVSRSALATTADPSPPWVAVPALLAVALAGAALAAWLSRRLQVRYSGNE